ncbi:MAG: MFS transporter [Eubacteriales bacterium]|nr:MFS transporter [Eubacteriales bacterium]
MMQTSISQVSVPLPKRAKWMAQAGSVCLMLSIAMYGLVYATLTAPILQAVNAMDYVGLFSIFAALGISIMTPIGGKLGDLLGRRNIVFIAGSMCAIAGLIFPFVDSLTLLLILRLIVSLAQGAFIAAPYIIVGLINDSKGRPKAMGMLATAVAVGGVGGSILAGWLTKIGHMQLGIILPTIPLVIGILLIVFSFPNDKRSGKIRIDVPGVLAFVAMLTSLSLALNFGASMGWGNPRIIAGLVLSVVLFFLFLAIERRASDPLIPLRLFSNKSYSLLLLTGFICYFYQTAMHVFAPLAVISVLQKDPEVAGSLQMARALITIILPLSAGIWVSRKASNSWKAMAIATLLAAIPMLALGFTQQSTPVLLFTIALAVTGIAESFRAVSVTPAAQATLQPQDMGVGTSLTNFFNSMASTISATVFTVAYNAHTIADPRNLFAIQSGVNSVFRIAAIVSFVGFLIVVLVLRPVLPKTQAKG